MDNYGLPYDAGSPQCSDDELDRGSPQGMFSDGEEENRVRGCDFCLQERRWIEKVRELRVPCEAECLALAQKQVDMQEYYQKKFKRGAQKGSECGKTDSIMISHFVLDEKKMNSDQFREAMLRKLCPAQCNGCNNAALELHQEYAAYSFADDWRRGLMFSIEAESRSHELILATMRRSIAETRRNWEIVNQVSI
ncbi:hypothetical protein TELCIR_15800 [Teladorsagia circumcincta]|uniref:Uncharacterized protein n=1 Tax=Teladorsagia circumcincta TaxID=45464 RepID=A0A2G9TZH2_TELCI|nr:hypothetical protein TELCIR_15800 [Teladorsagia circumcincta]